MPKTQEELNALKEKVETVNEKLHELTEEELEQVTGGIDYPGPKHGDQIPGGDVHTGKEPGIKWN